MTRYARGSRAWGHCARSGRRMLLKDMVRDGYEPSLLVDPAWYEPPHPQERLLPAEDPIALRDPTGDRDSPEPDTPTQLDVDSTFGAPT